MQLGRYGAGARWYDVLSGERWVYRQPRLRAIDRLALGPGARVLDVGCGTGLNFAPVLDKVGADGDIVAVDRSEPMLVMARRRVADREWRNVRTVRGDAGDLADLFSGQAPFDAALFTYSLSIIGRWQEALRQAVTLLRSGGRIAVLDLALPRGRWRMLSPLARIACWTGGVDHRRRPWRALAGVTPDASQEILRAGHVHLAVGVKS